MVSRLVQGCSPVGLLNLTVLKWDNISVGDFPCIAPVCGSVRIEPPGACTR